jgi:N-acetylmuramoyl-L-alanine amidase/Putative peptidoglycan binding domain
MKGSKFIATLPEAPGPARERAILDAVRAGAVRVDWATVTSAWGGHVAEITVSADALAVGDSEDWVRVSLSHTAAQHAADTFSALLPTTRISDLIFEQAQVRLSPCLQRADGAMANTSRMLRHHEEIEGKRGGRTGLIATVGKDWVTTNRLAGRPDRAANYGWHDHRARNGKPWQPLGLAHDRSHVDYSQVVRLVRREVRVDGEVRDLVEVLGDPALAGLVSNEGPIQLWRLAALAEGEEADAAEQTRADPRLSVPRTLRRGLRGSDVTRWQQILGVVADGIFGATTEAATKRWQELHGLQADGVVGPRTRRAAGLGRGPAPAPAGGDGLHRFVQARNFKPANRERIDLVVVHSMEAAEKPATAENVAAWFASADAPVASAHYCIDADSIVQCVREKDVAYHAPGTNHNGVGLEHAGYARQSAEDWADDYSETMLRRSAELAATLCRKHDLPIVYVDAAGLIAGERGVTTHRAASAAFKKSDHTDPGPHFPMDHYLELIREFL